MLLRRLMGHVRTQNWLAVALDFVIVVSGVYIGIALGNWDEHHNEMAMGDRFERELVSDMRQDMELLNYSDRYFRQVAESARKTVEQLEAGRTDDPAQFLVDAYTATQYNYNAMQRATYEELVATGGLRLIRDDRLREAAIYLYTNPGPFVLSDYVRDSAYRDAVRRALPYSVQQAIREQCGDQRDEDGVISGLKLPCTLDLPAESVDAAVAVLLDHPTVEEDLRTFISTLPYYIDDQLLIVTTVERALAEVFPEGFQ